MAIISIVYGSVRPGRLGIRVARYLNRLVIERGHTVHFIDPVEHRFPFLERKYADYGPGEALPVMDTVSGWFKESDGFLIVSAEYNHSVPPPLKNILDHYQAEEYRFKPSAIASYSSGMFGGVRAAVHLRAVLGELGMPAIPTMQPYPNIGENFDEDGNPRLEITEKSTYRFLDEFEWYVEALKEARSKGLPY